MNTNFNITGAYGQNVMQEQLADIQAMEEAEMQYLLNKYSYEADLLNAHFNCPNCDDTITHHEHKAHGMCDKCYKGD